jgi:hypothetical protein
MVRWMLLALGAVVVACGDSDPPGVDGGLGTGDLGPPAADAAADLAPGADLPGPADRAGPDLAAPDAPPLPDGSSCTGGAECASGICADGVCCNRACDGLCQACNVTGMEGTCAPVPAGEDPANDCAQDPLASCARDGTCDGAGTCRRYQMAACPNSCSAPADCGAGQDCQDGACVLSGLVLHWRFDEVEGTTAMDSSGKGLHGTYMGRDGTPAPSPSVPPVAFTFANPRSRVFMMTDRHKVELDGNPSGSGFQLTVSVWFSAPPALDELGGDLVSTWPAYQLEITTEYIGWSNRFALGKPIAESYSGCSTPSPTFLDGRWHHVAVATSPESTRLYVDGIERCTNARSMIWPPYGRFTVGRSSAPDGLGSHFNGQLDDVRIYSRALTAAEVARLAAGGQ